MQKKQKREDVNEGPHRQWATVPGNSSSNGKGKGPIEYIYVESDTEPELTSDESKASQITASWGALTYKNVQENTPVKFQNNDAIMKQLKKIFKTKERIFFHGSYNAPVDPLISDKDHVRATAHDVWKVTGYRFRWEKFQIIREKYTNVCE